MSPTTIRSEALRLEEDCLYTARGNFVASTRWQQIHFWVGIPAAVLAALAGLSVPFADSTAAEIVGAAFGVTSGSLAAVLTFLDPKGRAHQHHAVGTKFNNLRRDARQFATVFLPEMEGDEAKARLLQLSQTKTGLDADSPIIPPWAYEAAKRGIEAGEATYKDEAG